MGLVLRYSFRNLWRHKARSLLTALTVAMVVAVCAAMAGFSRGVLVAARQSGSPANVIVLDRKAAIPGINAKADAEIMARFDKARHANGATPTADLELEELVAPAAIIALEMVAAAVVAVAPDPKLNDEETSSSNECSKTTEGEAELSITMGAANPPMA